MPRLNEQDRDYLRTYDPGVFRKPSSSVDVVIFTVQDGALKVLLSHRKSGLFAGQWGFPGGFIRPTEHESLDAAAHETLARKTKLRSPYLEQLRTYGSAGRDPRDWVLTVVYFALVPEHTITRNLHGNEDTHRLIKADGDRIAVRLAFDHAVILRDAVARLRGKLEYTSIAMHLMPDEFTIPELQRAYETVLGEKLDRSSFHARTLRSGFVEEVGRTRETAGRPSKLFRSIVRDDRELFFPRSIAWARRKNARGQT